MANPPQEAYITAAWGNPLNVPTMFTVGDGTLTTVDSVMYENVGLSSDTDYAYIIRFDIMSDTSNQVSWHYILMYLIADGATLPLL